MSIFAYFKKKNENNNKQHTSEYIQPDITINQIKISLEKENTWKCIGTSQK